MVSDTSVWCEQGSSGRLSSISQVEASLRDPEVRSNRYHIDSMIVCVTLPIGVNVAESQIKGAAGKHVDAQSLLPSPIASMVNARYVSGDEGPIDSAQAVFES